MVGKDSEPWGFFGAARLLCCCGYWMKAPPVPPGGRGLQRLFSTFPGGRPGVGLLLLRVALGGALIGQGAAYLINSHSLTPAAWIMMLLALASGGCLLIGYLTPLAAVLGGGLLLCFPALPQDLPPAKIATALAVAIAVAILCIGPGAFSLDARLFGRREIVIPDLPHPPLD